MVLKEYSAKQKQAAFATCPCQLIYFFFNHLFESQAENQITRVSGNCAFVLSPKERPIVVVLEMVGLAEEYARRHIARNEREIGTVIPIKY